jgi:hypothetical protein
MYFTGSYDSETIAKPRFRGVCVCVCVCGGVGGT